MTKNLLVLWALLGVVGVYAQNPFADESQVVMSSGKGDLYGSLVIPTGDSAENIVLIVPDSGPTDRNGNQKMMKNNAYRMLAVNLANKNTATLRYDKRGIGASRYSQPSNEIELSCHVEDLKGWINLIRRDGRFKNVYLLGHGEGSLISLAAINEGARVNGFISVSGMGRSFDQVLKDQLAEEPYYVRNISYQIIDSLKAGEKVSFVPFYLASMFRPVVQPFLRSIMKYDPQKMIRNVHIPVAIIHGDTDIQTKIEDARLLHASNHNSRLIIIVGMNHVMKNCASIDRDMQAPTYINPTIPINNDLVEVINEFINKN